MALVCDVYCDLVTLPFGILGQVWYLIVSSPDPCCLTLFLVYPFHVYLLLVLHLDYFEYTKLKVNSSTNFSDSMYFFVFSNPMAKMSVTDREPETAIDFKQPQDHVKRLWTHTEMNAALFDASCKRHSDRINGQCKVIEELVVCDLYNIKTIEACEALKAR